jgi:hypothetical protein
MNCVDNSNIYNEFNKERCDSSNNFIEQNTCNNNEIIDVYTIKNNNNSTNKIKQYIMPTSSNFEILKTEKYRIVELKKIAKKYNLKVSGKKQELITRIYDFLSTYQRATSIQAMFKGYIVRKFMLLHGPCLKPSMRSKCVNDSDFMTLDSISELDYNQLYSYKDEKGFYYCFDICSLYNLFKAQPTPFNPYTRELLKPQILKDVKDILRYSRLLRQPIQIDIDDQTEQITDMNKLLLLQIERIFQKMDDLGNYTNSDWLSSLSRNGYIRYFRELYDIWVYRAQLQPITKQEICPPVGNPFTGFNVATFHLKTDIAIKQSVVNVIERMITSGINESSKSLGCFYVLAALTLVNQQAADALPWLYESVIH